MQAVQLTEWGNPAVLREVPRPQAGPGEVLLEVRAAGLCHSDLHLMHWPAGTLPYELPFTLGHEVAGTVAALGAGANGVEVGESVIVYGPWGCGRCPRCSVGEEHLCEAAGRRGRGSGLGRDGGLAGYMVVPSPRLTVPLGDLDPVAAAPLADAAPHPVPRHLPRAAAPARRRRRGRDRRRRARPRRRPAPAGADVVPHRRRRPARGRARDRGPGGRGRHPVG